MSLSNLNPDPDKNPADNSVFQSTNKENLGSKGSQGRKKGNACGRKLTQIKTKISDRAAAYTKTAKALKYTAIALLVLTILGGALLAYMHFSGLGISKAGFVQLGHQISNLANKAWTKFIDAMKAPAHLNIGEVIGIAAGSALGGVLLTEAGIRPKKACVAKAQERTKQIDEKEVSSLHEHSEETHVQSPTNLKHEKDDSSSSSSSSESESD